MPLRTWSKRPEGMAKKAPHLHVIALTDIFDSSKSLNSLFPWQYRNISHNSFLWNSHVDYRPNWDTNSDFSRNQYVLLRAPWTIWQWTPSGGIRNGGSAPFSRFRKTVEKWRQIVKNLWLLVHHFTSIKIHVQNDAPFRTTLTKLYNI
jgi:hypothetical protein